MTENRGQRTEIKKLRVGFFLLLFCFLFSVFCPLVSYADKIYLKDGKAYEGKLIGKSPRRFLFSVDLGGGEIFQMSFFSEDVQKLELSKDTVEEQIPYLKDVETSKFEVKQEEPRTYELSLYQGGQKESQLPSLSVKELKGALNEQEAEYYQRFNDILKKYMDKFAAIQNIYTNLTTATREDFVSAKQYMDELYFELNNLFVPEVFKKPHMDYLASVKASFLAFQSLEQGQLEEAAKQIKISEDSKQKSMSEFRDVIVTRKPKSTETENGKNENIPVSNEVRNP